VLHSATWPYNTSGQPRSHSAPRCPTHRRQGPDFVDEAGNWSASISFISSQIRSITCEMFCYYLISFDNIWPRNMHFSLGINRELRNRKGFGIRTGRNWNQRVDCRALINVGERVGKKRTTYRSTDRSTGYFCEMTRRRATAIQPWENWIQVTVFSYYFYFFVLNTPRRASASTNSSHSIRLFSTSSINRKIVLNIPLRIAVSRWDVASER